MLVDILQKFNLNSVRVTLTGKDYVASKTEYLSKTNKSRKKKMEVLFTGLTPDTKYKVVVQSLGECSYSKKVKKATGSTCSKSCINGKCIRKRRGERCKCMDGYIPSRHGSKRNYDICFPEDGSCRNPLYNLCPSNASCLESRATPGKYVCQCNPGYGFDRRRKSCKPSRTISVYGKHRWPLPNVVPL